MRNYISTTLAVMIALALGVGVVGPQYLNAKQNSALARQSDCQSFRETGKQVCGRFYSYWREHGGLMQQGFPISSEFREVSPIDGKTYTVQYFERAVFEYHPENAPPYDVLLSLLGVMFFKERYPNGAPELPGQMNPVAGRHFPETGKEIRGEFLKYWEKNGGLAQQGYPISNPFYEKSAVDGKEYLVQYFERAVFELHPENAPPYNVLLSQLGTMQFKRKYPNGEPKPGASTRLQTGKWGGEQVMMEVTATGALIEFGCAHGIIKQAITVDGNGRFEVMGTFVFERGGPTLENQPPDEHPARYSGSTDGNTLTITITITDQNRVLGPYRLTYGKESVVVKCQ